MPENTVYSFERRGRHAITGIVIVIVWILCLLAIVIFDAVIWFVALMLVFTLPAVWDMVRNAVAGLTLTDQSFSWFSGKARADVALSEIDKMRFVTRLDMTVRVEVVLTSGRKLRLPPESTPPHKPLQEAFDGLGIRTERHHFSLL